MDFELWLDRWEAQERPEVDLRLIVTAWVIGRHDDPYQDARRAVGFPNLWYAVIPGSEHGDQVVICAYWVTEGTRTVRCDSIATLSAPI